MICSKGDVGIPMYNEEVHQSTQMVTVPNQIEIIRLIVAFEVSKRTEVDRLQNNHNSSFF